MSASSANKEQFNPRLWWRRVLIATRLRPTNVRVDEKSILDLLKDLAGFSGLALALSYLAGWSYLNFYYDTFGIEPWVFDIPAYNFAPLFIVIFNSGWLPFLVYGIFLVEVWALARWFSSWKHFRILAVASIVLVSFLMVIVSGSIAGANSASYEFRNPTRVHLLFRDDKKVSVERSLVEANNLKLLGLVGQSKDIVVVFDSSGELKGANVYVLSRSDLFDIQITTK